MCRPPFVAGILLLSACAHAPKPPVLPPEPPAKILAVLEVAGEGLTNVDRDTGVLTDALRGATAAGSGRAFQVMPRDLMARLVPPEKRRCGENLCMAEVGRMLSAQVVVGGTLRKLDGAWALTVEGYETTGRSLGAKVLRGATWTALLETMEAEGPGLVRGWLRTSLEPVSLSRTRHWVRFESEPPGATVMVDGNLACNATPCAEELPAGRHEVTASLKAHETARETIEVGERSAPVRFVLPPLFGTLDVETEPPGLALFVDGEPAGHAPLIRRVVSEGVHDVTVVDACYGNASESFEAVRGETSAVRLQPVPRLTELEVTVVDAKSRPVDAAMAIDGEPFAGRGPFMVPLCAKLLTLEASDGRRAQAALQLRERDRTHVRIMLGESVGAADPLPPKSDAPVTAKSLSRGTRVRRGPDWKWAEQDGNGVGLTTSPVDAEGWVLVRWETGVSNLYRWGAEGAFDLHPVEE